MNNRKELAELIQQWSDNPDSYFTIGGVKSIYTPNSESNLNDWKLIVPPKKWKSKYHEKGFYVEANGNVENFDDVPDTFQNELLAQFRVRETKKQAKDLAKILKEVSLIDAWACEYGYKIQFEYDKPDNYFIFYHAASKEWIYSNAYYVKHPGRVYMTEEGCRLLCKKLNSGEIEL